MKTKEELNALKEEVETLNKKLHELSEEELEQVNGGIKLDPDRFRKKDSKVAVKITGFAEKEAFDE